MLTIGRFADATGLTSNRDRGARRLVDNLPATSQRFIAGVLGQGLRPGQAIRIEFVEYHVLARLVWPLSAA